MKRGLPILAAALAAGIVALVVNLLLVDYASGRDDPVGKLSPRVSLTPSRAPTTATTTQPIPTQPQATTGQTTTGEDDDDDRGRGRGRGRGGDGNSGSGSDSSGSEDDD